MQAIKQNVVVGVAEAAPTYYIRRVKTKLASGIYKTEKVDCFCGSKDYFPLTKKDRYGFDHIMNLCEKCGLIFTSPRMTEDSYKEFYKNEYLPIYDAYDEPDKAMKDNSISNGISLLASLTSYDIKPKKVLDIGCSRGYMLLQFKNAGAEVLGIDYVDNAVIPLYKGSLSELAESGQKFDFIIMHHILEHVNDIEATMSDVSKLLTPSGFLHIGVPTLYKNKIPKGMMQNAHTYQFTCITLVHTMATCGFEDVYCDEDINSIWQFIGEKIPKSTGTEEAREIMSFFKDSNKIRTIKTINKFPLMQRKKNIDFALSLGLPDISQLINKYKNGKAVIIGGGPSANNYVEKIKEFKQQGYIIFAIERMYAWCLNHGIIPDYMVVLDACDDVIESFNVVKEEVTHLISTQCSKETLERLQPFKSFVFMTPQKGVNPSDYWNKYGYGRVAIINAGGSVVIGCVSLAMSLGCNDLHIFGFDCHVTNGQYAKGITGVGEQKFTYDIQVEDRTFTTTNAYLSFVQQFSILIDMGENQGKLKNVKIYGDSLAKAMLKKDIDGDREG